MTHPIDEYSADVACLKFGELTLFMEYNVMSTT